MDSFLIFLEQTQNLLPHPRTEPQRLLITTVASLVASWGLYRLVLLSTSRRSQQPLPGDNSVPRVRRGLPMLGHCLELKRNYQGFLDRCKAEYGPAFYIQLINQDVYVLAGPLIAEAFSASQKNLSFTAGIESLVPMSRVIKLSYAHKFMGEHISPREKHPVTYIIKHKFKPDEIGVFSERIQKGFATALASELALKPGEKKAVVTWDFMSVTISYISCPCFAGSRVGNNPELIKAMAVFMQKIIKAGTFLSLLPGWLGDFLVRHFLSVEKELDLIMELIVPELAKIQLGELDDHEPTFISMALSLPRRDGSRRSIQDTAFWFKEVALASIHSTSHFTTFALHELACRPALLADLREKIRQIRGPRTPESVSSQVPLLDSFLREVLRYNIDYLGLPHRAVQDVMLSTGQVIPKDGLVFLALRDNHDHPLEPDAAGLTSTPLNEFDAYRYVLQTDTTNATPRIYQSSMIGLNFTPFGLGAHACPGRYFAVNEIKFVLAEIIMRYNLSTASGQRAKEFIIMGITRLPPREPIIFEAIQHH